MGTLDATTALTRQIDRQIKKDQSKRNQDRRKATYLKMVSVLLASVVTVLVGVQGESFDQHLLRNLALVLSATITLVNAFDAFFDHRSLWISRTVTVSRLHELRRDLELEVARSQPNDMLPDQLAVFQGRFNQVLRDALSDWLKLRSEVPPGEHAVAGSSPGGTTEPRDG